MLAAASQRPKILILSWGESNAGGAAPNASLTTTEANARADVQVWNVNTDVYQNLDIGTNNNLDHSGLTSASHGIENGIANAVAAGRFVQSQVYFVQTGQGGALIDYFRPSFQGWWEEAIARYTAARAALTGSVTLIPFFTIGINDSDAGTNVATFKTDLAARIAGWRAVFGSGQRIYLTTFNSNHATFNTAITEVATADGNITLIATRDTGVEWQTDRNHWTYVGYKSLANALIDAALSASVTATPSISPAAGVYESNPTITLSGSGNLLYTIDGTDPNIGTAYSAPFTLTLPDTVEVRAWQQGKAMSSIASAAYTQAASSNPPTWNTTDATAQGYALTSTDTAIARTGSGWSMCRATGGKTTGKWYFELVCEAAPSGSNPMMVGLANAGASNGTYLGNSNHGIGFWTIVGQFPSSAFSGGSGASIPDELYATNSIMQVCVDFDAGRVWVGKNNTWQGSGNPAAGTNPATTFSVGTTGAIFPAVAAADNTMGRWRIQGGFTTTHTPPSGFSGWTA